MGSLTRSLIIILSVSATITLMKSNADDQYYPLPLTKHEPTNQFYTTVSIESTAVNLLLDLGTNLTWLNCRHIKYLPSLVTCHSSLCKSIPGDHACDRKSCLYKQPNPLGLYPFVTGRVVQGTLSIIFTSPGGPILPSQIYVNDFTFSCASEKNLQGLPLPMDGVAGLSPASSSFTRQVMSLFRASPKFSLCLPSSGIGRFHVGGVPFMIPPFNDFLMTLTTPLEQTDSGNYVIYVTSIYVDGFTLPLNPKLLEGGAKLSTVEPYTVLHSHIYNALARSFTLKAKKIGISKVAAIAPFKDCFDAPAAGKSMTGPIVPLIEIEMPGRLGELKWSFYGANTMVKVTETVMCLAFLDGGKKPKEVMVVGTHQLQDYMVEIDISKSLLTTSHSLLLYNTSCSTWL